MPKIIGQAEQQRAMREIRSGLKELEAINAFLNSTSKDKKYSITFVNQKGQKVTATAYSEQKGAVDLLIENQRDLIIGHLKKLAQNNRIEFDEEDLMILENEPSPVAEIPEPPEDFSYDDEVPEENVPAPENFV